MLLGALTSNVQFDWKSRWSTEEGPATQQNGCLFAAALEEYAILRSGSSGVYPSGYQDAEGRAKGTQGGLVEQKEAVEKEATRVLLRQARQRGEADLLLMCCHCMSPFLPVDRVPRSPVPDAAAGEGLIGGGWWMRPSAVRSRALARLLCNSAVTSARGEELVRRVEAHLQQMDSQTQHTRGQPDSSDVSPEADDADMLDVCLWALVLLGNQENAQSLACGATGSPVSGDRAAGQELLSTEAMRHRLVRAMLQDKVSHGMVCVKRLTPCGDM